MLWQEITFRSIALRKQTIGRFGSGIGGIKKKPKVCFLMFIWNWAIIHLQRQYLDSLKNMSDFGYMIRLAKWNDYKGDLDTTITFMEKAKEKANRPRTTN